MIVFTLCAFAMVRVFFFCAVFPFFNNVDEPSHYDLVRKYARGHVPTGIEHFDAGAVRDILFYRSPEYIVPVARFPGSIPPPPVWTLPFERIQKDFETGVGEMATGFNHESTQPPLYYMVAALWWRFGEALGLSGGQLLYWLRFMNVLVCGLLVWLSHLFARTFFPDRRFLRLGMPLLVTFLPQDVFYSINNDVLLPLAGGAVLWALFILMRGGRQGYAFHAVAGLLLAAVLLIKPSGVPVAVMAMVTAVAVVLRTEKKTRRAAIGRIAVLLLAAGVPLSLWALRNALVLGDVTGSAAKTSLLGWSVKPIAAIFDHPLFTPGGLITFWHETMTSFWRGEFTWGLERISSGGWDLFYSVSSLVLPAAAIAALVIRRRSVAREEQTMLWMSLTAFTLSLLFLAVLSVIYDFGTCFYPSRAHPFMASGRIALAALLPFVALYLAGLEVLVPGRRAAPLRWGMLIAVVAWMTFSEIAISHDALHSRYNWFHLLNAAGG
jgi:hypothetical protein